MIPMLLAYRAFFWLLKVLGVRPLHFSSLLAERFVLVELSGQLFLKASNRVANRHCSLESRGKYWFGGRTAGQAELVFGGDHRLTLYESHPQPQGYTVFAAFIISPIKTRLDACGCSNADASWFFSVILSIDGFGQ